MRRREFLLASACLSAGCLSPVDNEPEPESDPVEAFDVEASLGAAEPVEGRDTSGRSFEFDDGEVVVHVHDKDEDDRSHRRLSHEDWENEICRTVGLDILRESLEDSVGVESYSNVVPVFGEVGQRVVEGDQEGRLAERGVHEGTEVLMVQHVSAVNRDGEVVISPALTYEEAVEATPESVRLRVPVDSAEEDRVVDCPVVVWRTARRRD